jgi:hypothetical protein
MPNGEYVDVPEGISAAALAKIESQYKQTRVQKREAAAVETKRVLDRQPSVQERAMIERDRRAKERTPFGQFADAYSNTVDPTRWLGGLAGSGQLFNFDDELQGIGGGIKSALRGRGFRDGYSVNREIREQEKSEARTRNPIAGTVAEIAGSLANPIGTGASTLKGAGTLASRVLPSVGARLTGAGTRLANAGSIAKGVATGVNVGALNAAGSSESLDQVPGDAAAGALFGGAFGGALSVAGRAGQGAFRILRDRSPKAAKRVAFEQINKALERGEISPEVASKMLAKANREGGDAMLMDLSPNLTSMALNLSRNPNLRTSNAMIARGEQRATSRAGRIAGKIEGTAELPQGIRDFNALREADTLSGARKGQGGFGYGKGGALDNELSWTKELEDGVRSAPNFERLMQAAFNRAEQFGDDIGRIDEGKVIPSMRVWDYLKREYDSIIKQSYRAGDETSAAAYSAELGRIKDHIVAANPRYERVLAAQRDYFQQENALRLGEQLWKDLAKSPRQTGRKLASMKPKELDQARVGMIDKLINDVLTSPNPLTVLAKVTNASNPAQRKVLETVFGSKQRYNQFMRYLRTEISGQRSDSVTRYAGQSQTSRAQQAGAAIEGDMAELGVAGTSGVAFGGPAGGAANIARSLMRKASITSEAAQDEIAKLLMSRGGDDFIASIRNAIAYKKRQLANNDTLTSTVTKAGLQPITTQIGGE